MNKGLRIHTTLDSTLQKKAKAAIDSSDPIFKKAEDLVLIPFKKKKQGSGIQGAIISSDPRSGEILSMVGGRDYKKTKFNRTIQSLRQPGSAFKPIVYSLALANGMKWSDLHYVSPIAVDNYRPKNFSKQFLTEVTMLRAFFRSINTPTVEIGSKLGLKAVIRHAKKMGISSPIKPETGLFLGASEVSMLDILRAYSTIANYGVKVEPIAISKITDRYGKVLYEAPSLKERSVEVISKQDAYLMIEGLRTVFRNGTAYSHHEMGAYAAGKTGTSNASRDNWFVGFTPSIATAVWVGSDKSYEFLGRATGTSLALPIWAKYMRAAVSKSPPPPFEQPVGIVMKRVHSKYGYTTSSGLRMYFKKGDVPTRETSDLKVLSETGKYRTLFEN